MKNPFLSGCLLSILTINMWAQNWQHMGPHNTSSSGQYKSGRADVLCLHPTFTGQNTLYQNTIYLGSHSGGLYVTANGGGNWTNISLLNTGANIKYGGVSALAIQQSGGSLYLADYNPAGCSGVYKYQPLTGIWSTTGPFNGVTQPFVIHHLKVHPANDAYVYACTNQGLFISVNNGQQWSAVTSAPGNIENIAFMPRLGGTGLYPYYIYASGTNSFLVSSDDGQNFTPVSCIQSLFSNYQSVHGNIAYTPSYTIVGDNYIYIYAFTVAAGNINEYCLFRYNYNSTTGTETGIPVNVNSGTNCYQDYDNNDDRLAVTADDQTVYYGGVVLNNFSVTHGAGSIGVNHTDQHDIFYHRTTNMIFSANDGGFASGTYYPSNTPDDGQGVINLIQEDVGLDISQISAFSSSALRPDTFLTEEADNNAFYNSEANGTLLSFGNEAEQILFDKDYLNTYYYHDYYNGADVQSVENGVHNVSQTHRYNPDPTTFCGSDTYLSTEPFYSEFGVNSIFQDPNRPGKVYYGTLMPPTLNEFCPANHRFETKYVPSSCLPGMSWYQLVNSMGFTAADKNKTYITCTNRYWQSSLDAPPSVIRYNGSDIDQAWITNSHPCDWIDMSPSLSFYQSFNSSISQTDLLKIWYPGIAVSDWDPDKFWLIISGTSIFNGNMPSYLANTSLISNKVVAYDHGIWTDYSQGIPADEYPLSIVYEKGTNDAMYLGTNRAVYYRNAKGFSAQWQLYSDNLPVSVMSQMEINYKTNTVRTGTYGYGVWKNQLMCPANNTFVTTGNITSDYFAEATSYLTVQNETVSNGYAKYRSAGHIDFVPSTLITASSTCKAYAFIHSCVGPGNNFRQLLPDQNIDEILVSAIDALHESKNDLRIYPNPSKGWFTIDLYQENKEEIEKKAASVFIFDLLGNKVYGKERIKESHFEINISDQPDGVYLIKCIANDRISNIKIIKE